MKTAVVCIAKEEAQYIDEWIEYHHKLGFDHFFIYENDWDYSIDKSYVTTIPFNGKHQQMPAYTHFLNQYRTKFNWATFIDCDEFIVLKKHSNIKDFIKEYDNPFGIGINWQCFGSNGKLERDPNSPNSLIKQFTLRQEGVNKHIKTIMNLASQGYMVYPHNPNTRLMDTNRNFFRGPFNPKGDISVAQINHYHYKTFEDWKIRCKRGQADHAPAKTLDKWEKDKKSCTQLEDKWAYNFMYKEDKNDNSNILHTTTTT